jgi:threonine/homoserine/homoserine lactone efflux protein
VFPTGHLLAFALVSFALIAVPGPNVLFVISRSLAAGAVRGWFTRSPRRLELIGGTGGLVMIGIGVSLALTGRQD